MRDRASVNEVALLTIKVVFPDMIDVGCHSHTTDLVGDKCHTPNLDGFIHLWISLIARSPRAQLWWKSGAAREGNVFLQFHHLWSKWEVMSQVILYMGDYVAPFLRLTLSCHHACYSSRVA